MRFEARHLARLARDAAALGLGAVDAALARRALHELGHAVFGAGEGVVRLEARRSSDGGVSLAATTRSLGADPGVWRAITAPLVHEGGPAPHGAKLALRPLYTRAAEQAAGGGADEALLLDAQGRLVEGARSNLVAVGVDGVAAVPPAERGAVAGVALEACLVLAPPGTLVRRDVPREDLPRLRELVALNAVRGAVPIVALDGHPVGDGAPGPLASRLAAILDAHA